MHSHSTQNCASGVHIFSSLHSRVIVPSLVRTYIDLQLRTMTVWAGPIRSLSLSIQRRTREDYQFCPLAENNPIQIISYFVLQIKFFINLELNLNQKRFLDIIKTFKTTKKI
jgi:hypothetical protein